MRKKKYRHPMMPPSVLGNVTENCIVCGERNTATAAIGHVHKGIAPNSIVVYVGVCDRHRFPRFDYVIEQCECINNPTYTQGQQLRICYGKWHPKLGLIKRKY